MALLSMRPLTRSQVCLLTGLLVRVQYSCCSFNKLVQKSDSVSANLSIRVQVENTIVSTTVFTDEERFRRDVLETRQRNERSRLVDELLRQLNTNAGADKVKSVSGTTREAAASVEAARCELNEERFNLVQRAARQAAIAARPERRAA